MGNVRWTHSSNGVIEQAFQGAFLQLYTPYPKPLRNRKPFTGHPYTLTKVLGTGVINDNPHFKCDKKAIENRVDYRSLMEAIANDDLHQRFEARVEVAATSTDLDFLRNLDVTVVAEELVANNLLIVEVSLFSLHIKVLHDVHASFF